MDIYDFFKGDKYAVNAGVELLEVRKGYAKVRMLITPEHLNGGGTCQGGALFTMADLACAAASNSHGRLTVSVSADIHFYKAESSGYLYAEANEVFDKKRLSGVEVRISNAAEELVATFNSVSYRRDVELPFEPY